MTGGFRGWTETFRPVAESLPVISFSTHSEDKVLTFGRKLTQKELEEKGGIKAQHAVYRALKAILARANTGWDVEETIPGSAQDRNGVDIYLVNKSLGVKRILDVSMRAKPESEGTLVRIYADWFVVNDDGSWSLLPECEHRLMRALLPTMSAPHLLMGS